MEKDPRRAHEATAEPPNCPGCSVRRERFPKHADPSVVNAAGLWTGTSRLDTVSGGDRVGATMAALIGTTANITVQITQNGSVLMAMSTATATGDTAHYSGTAGSSSISLDWTSMSAGIVTGFRCSNGERRDMEVRTDAITATISGNTQTGTEASSWNIKVTGTDRPSVSCSSTPASR